MFIIIYEGYSLKVNLHTPNTYTNSSLLSPVRMDLVICIFEVYLNLKHTFQKQIKLSWMSELHLGV